MAPREARKCAHAANLRNTKVLVRYDLGAMALRAAAPMPEWPAELHLPEQRRVRLAHRQRLGATLESKLNATAEVALQACELGKGHDDRTVDLPENTGVELRDELPHGLADQ